MLTDFQVSAATGTAERDAAAVLLNEACQRGFRPRTMGGDKNYDTRDCVKTMRKRGVTPHVAQNTGRRSSAIDGRGTRVRGRGLTACSGRGSISPARESRLRLSHRPWIWEIPYEWSTISKAFLW